MQSICNRVNYTWQTRFLFYNTETMKKQIPFFIFLFLFPFLHTQAQTCTDASVEITAQVQTVPPKITLNWAANGGATQHLIYRKLKSGNSWAGPIATLGGSATQYIDSTVMVGVSYDYKILRTGSVTGYGYINSGIEIPVIDARGKIILLVDSTMAAPLAVKLNRLEDDLEGDGWIVIRHDISRTAPVTAVKSMILADYNADPINVKSVFLFGHIPVPYSGDIYPDGHPDHEGAWPADVYYADMNGTWTDATVSVTVASSPRHHNIPGDGKFDQSQIPSDLELQVGRVDFSDMPAFALNEQQLLEAYLDKDHNYRHKVFAPLHQAIVDDNFGYFSGEAFAASGFKNFSPLVGTSNVFAGDYFTDMASASYLWSYGCGGGSYTSAGGIGYTSDFAAANLQGVFSMLFGSYFGDWDVTNSFLRAPLAQGTVLSCVWSGRPHWVFTHMALGEPMGYDVKLSQNNSGLYFASYGGRMIHSALMGDPTLRNDVVAPVSAVVATVSGTNCIVSWTSSPDAVLGYNVYMKNDTMPDYVLRNNVLITGNSFTDTCLLYPGTYTYMVRAMKMETSPSGTYYNLSQGISDTAWNTNDLAVHAIANYSAAANVITFTNTSTNAISYSWNFGDSGNSTQQNPTHSYLDGNYTVTLVASNGCDSDTTTLTISIATGIAGAEIDASLVEIYPNPSSGKFELLLHEIDFTDASLMIFNSNGALVQEEKINNSKTQLDLSGKNPGMYYLVFRNGKGEGFSKRVLIQD